MADLASELATPSFFPEIKRVVVVEQLADLLSAPSDGQERTAGERSRGKTKKTPEKRDDPVASFCRFLERDLPQTGNVLILTVIEEPDKRRRIQTSSPLYKTIASLGRILEFKEASIVFRFLDAFSNRDLNLALRTLPDILQEEDGCASVFRLLVRQVRFLIQAKLLEKIGDSRTDIEDFSKRNFPPEKGLNLLLEHPFTVEKTRRAAARWTISELNALLPRLERLIKIIYPSVNDTYVPDPDIALERFILEACARNADSRSAPLG